MQLSTVNPTGELVAFEGYLVDRRRWLITHRGEAVPLKRKAFDLLLFLLDRHDQVVSKDALMAALWSNLIVEESNVTQQIFLLRKALNRHESGRKIIETVPGRGYRFIPLIEHPPPEASAGGVLLNAHTSRFTMTISEDTDVDSPIAAGLRRATELTGRRWSGVAAVACAVFALGGYGLRCWQEHISVSPDKAFASLQDPSPGAITSIGRDMSHVRY